MSKKIFKKMISVDGKKGRIEATLEYKSLGNQAPYFGVTGVVFTSETSSADRYWSHSGAIHNDILNHFPELADAVSFHLMSEEEPMHYIANTLYWFDVFKGLRKYNEKETPEEALTHAQNCAKWPDMPREINREELKNLLIERLPKLREDFRSMLKKYELTCEESKS